MHQRAFEIHECLAGFLDALAVLAGCTESIGGQLPNGLRPDVIRIDSRRDVLFVGDAKNTESPNCKSTRFRLGQYIGWLAIQVRSRKGIGLFAICHSHHADGEAWARTVSELAREEGINSDLIKSAVFDTSYSVQLFVFNGIAKRDRFYAM